ncbi:envelope stress response activation lipoprotein NlpE [Xenorhabdus nematophila]|nr:Outer membrane lipoprotein, involved in copper homeostasis and in adhesion [Xenorhabdus nematophila F1]CEE90706.1 outer membrane lipoprotein, involved in copper homeostasis and in adhesion [Xenorhabdus nematophila str. Anatoliense]CEE93060.1 outer membrane lipoprotein, involved in copper homeostasis and in adhesion [Xenorhabdus nematophila str. Anatoliense]
MMNKKIVLALLAAGVFTVVGCQNHSALQDTSVSQISTISQNKILPTEKVFNGIVPCADCAGIDTTLQLAKDGTYILGQTYLEAKNEENNFFDAGNWITQGKKIVLTNQNGNQSYYQMQGEDLVMLDIHGQPIESNLNYKLDKVTSKKLFGEYSYFADSALFTECRTGKRYDASENIDLERGYGEMGVEGGTLVYVEIEGYYTLRPSMEDGLFDNAVIQTGNIRFDKAASCKTKK